MYNTADVQIPHNLSSTEWLTIRMVDVLIVSDLNDLLLKLNTPDSTGRASGGIVNIDSTNINLFRVEGYVFDDVNYTGPNELGRGWITFWYKPD